MASLTNAVLGKTVRISQLTDTPHAFKFVLDAHNFKTMEPRLSFDKNGMVCLGYIHWFGERLKLSGAYNATWSKPCERCLKNAEMTSDGTFELFLLPLTDSKETLDREIFLTDPDIDYFDQEIIELSDYFVSQFFLDLPEFFICSKNCRGICPFCGVNKNKQSCVCDNQNGNYPFKFVLK